MQTCYGLPFYWLPLRSQLSVQFATLLCRGAGLLSNLSDDVKTELRLEADMTVERGVWCQLNLKITYEPDRSK